MRSLHAVDGKTVYRSRVKLLYRRDGVKPRGEFMHGEKINRRTKSFRKLQCCNVKCRLTLEFLLFLQSDQLTKQIVKYSVSQ